MNSHRPRLHDRSAKQALEAEHLGPFALHAADSAGRRSPEPEDPLRTVYERDRDRIVHATAFRRLMYKTQVFVNWEGDHHRTRLSHSLEVAQVARSVGSALRLNEPLCEALALAHDIGHPPFGHRGESALDELMADHGGFRHNVQVLRVVDRLERRSPNYAGLNLTRELRESLLKHEKQEDWPEEFGLKPRWPYLEAQVVDLADSTAYNVHDIEDGLRAGMIAERDLAENCEIWRLALAGVERNHPGFLAESEDRSLRIKRATGEILRLMIEDLIDCSAANLADHQPQSPSAARSLESMAIGYGPNIRGLVAELHGFLYRAFYRHEYLMRMASYAREVMQVLFEHLIRTPSDLPEWYLAWTEEVGVERAICDYLAGMTDRFAEREYERITGRAPIVPRAEA